MPKKLLDVYIYLHMLKKMNSTAKKINTQQDLSREVPLDLRDRSYWVTYQLRLRDETYGSVGKRMKKTAAAVRQALFQPSFEVEKKLASVLGLTARELFPERYDETGKRKFAVRSRK